MKKSEAIRYFGSVAGVARALEITPGAVSQWPEDVPSLRAFQLERLTDGRLKASASDYGPARNPNTRRRSSSSGVR